jgi:hypothetical protein
MFRKALFALAISTSFTSCFLIHGEDEKLSGKPELIASKKLRLDGYFYELDTARRPYPTVYILFRNGVLLTPGGHSRDSLTFVAESLKSEQFLKRTSTAKWMWGIFRIENDKIEIEKWYPTSGQYDVWRSSGNILNDSTFVLTMSENQNGTQRRKIEELYRFHPLTTKPDSVSVFIDY